eukprot:2941848-Pyramimonas_sp.AAC.1
MLALASSKLSRSVEANAWVVFQVCDVIDTWLPRLPCAKLLGKKCRLASLERNATAREERLGHLLGAVERRGHGALAER